MEARPCPRGSSRTNFVALVLALASGPRQSGLGLGLESPALRKKSREFYSYTVEYYILLENILVILYKL
jgi:hypothetical protein